MDLEGVRHEGMVVYSASSSKLLINWSDGPSARTDAPGHVLVASDLLLLLCSDLQGEVWTKEL